MSEKDAEARANELRGQFDRLKAEVQKVIVGHDEVVDGVLSAIFVGGHCLLEGVPGLGKTLLVRTVARCLDLRFSRIQFTPDLMPADIIGTTLVEEDRASGGRSFRFRKGPIFAQIVLADEVNRATPKTQSALLEAMQEGSVTVGGEIHVLEQPFFVLATQNPLEMEGTYPLPEAQLDRFLFKLDVSFSSRAELLTILDRTTGAAPAEPAPVLDGKAILRARAVCRDVVAAPHVKDYAVRLVLATHPGSDLAPEKVKRFVRFGSSPRGAQALVLGAKLRALREGRFNVSFDDVASWVHRALRHRLILSFEGEAEGIGRDAVLDAVLEAVPRVAEGAPARAAAAS